MIFSGEILAVYDAFIGNEINLLTCVTFVGMSLIMGIIKYTLPQIIVMLYLSLFLTWWYPAIVYLAIPFHFVFKYLRTSWIVDDDLNETSKELEKKNIAIIKDLLYVGVAGIMGLYLPRIKKFMVIIGIVYGIGLMITILKGLFHIVFDIINRFKYKGYRNRKVVKKMDRKILEKDLRKIRSEKERAAYIEHLIESQVSLSGEWSNLVRPDLGNKNAGRGLSPKRSTLIGNIVSYFVGDCYIFIPCSGYIQARGVNIIIYTNQLTRTGFPAMQNAAKMILTNHRAKECDEICMPFKDIIRLIPEDI